MATSSPAFPMGLRCGRAFCTLWVALSIAAAFLAPLDIGTYTVYGVKVSGPQFLRLAGLPMLLMSVAMALSSYALWTHKYWFRPAVFAAFFVVPLLSTFLGPGRQPTMPALELAFYVLLAALGWLYLYRKHTVRAYYSILRLRQVGAA